MRKDSRRVDSSLLAPVAAVLASGTLLALVACTPTMSDQVTQSIGVLSQVQASAHPVEEDVFRNARGVAILDEAQWGLVIGHSQGRGLLLRKLAGAAWSAPCGIKAGSLSVGLTAGGQGRSVVIVFETDESVDAFVADGGYFVARAQGTIGDASGGTHEPVQRGGSVRAYTVSEGVYASLALGGMSFSIDKDVNEATYGPEATVWEILDGKVKAPVGQSALVARLERISRSAGAPTATAMAPLKTEATPPAQGAGAHMGAEKRIPVETVGASDQPPLVER